MSSPGRPPGVYHEGELAVQERAGVRDMAARIGRGIHALIPPAAAAFLRERRLVFLGAADAAGRPWAAALSGPAGFVQALDAQAVRIAAAPARGDPFGEVVEAAPRGDAARGTGMLVGLLAIDFVARRRVRVNGRLTVAEDGALHLGADQVYANCPKYIQARHVDDAPADGRPDDGAAAGRLATPARRGSTLTESQRELVRRADTFMIATVHPEAGADCSHRGGRPGFVRVEGERLTWPDYVGNAMFNTLGNIAAYPRAGLLFVDFERGSTLHLTGRAGIDWRSTHAEAVPGAERRVTLDVEEVVEVEHALPLRFRLLSYSPFNPPAHPDGAE